VGRPETLHHAGLRAYPPGLVRNARWIALLALAAAIALILLSHSSKIRVPAVVGLRYRPAATMIVGLRLCLKVDELADRRPAGGPLRVLAQAPAAGTERRSWSLVTIDVPDERLPRLLLPAVDDDPCPRVAATLVRSRR
jgi:hypothetical protein